jgi:regulator of sigma E protease
MSGLFSALPHMLHSTASFIVVLGVLVFIHEYGHYLAARFFGVQVLAFSIGFGRALTQWQDRHGTIWKLSILPLGGYVRLRGNQEDDPLPPDQIHGKTLPESPLYARAGISLAGPMANFALAILLYTSLFATVGREILLPVVGQLVPHGAAEKAGLLPGDRILAVNGTKIAQFLEMRALILPHPGEDVVLSVQRKTATSDIHVVLGSQSVGGHAQGMLGVIAGDAIAQHYALPAAFIAGIDESITRLGTMLDGLGRLLSHGEGASDYGGVILIAQVSGQAASLGVASLIGFMAFLSLNLGMVNLLPIPVLDGGHLMFYLAEALRGKPLPPKAQDYGYQAGFAIIATVFVLISWNDLHRVGLIDWVSHLFG